MFTSAFYHLLRWCPGGIGLLLRQKLYPYILGKCGHKVLFGRFVNIENPKKIHLGNNVIINDKVTLNACDFSDQGSAITIADNVFLGAGSSLYAKDNKIIIHSGSSIGSFCILEAKGTITIGKDVLLAAFCKIGYCPACYESLVQNKPANEPQDSDISIEPSCWLGVRSIILPGVSVGEGSIVGAHAIVQKSLPPYVVAIGKPAVVMRNRADKIE